MAKRMDMETAIRERAQRDDRFRDELLQDPRAAVSATMGFEIPDSLSVRVEQETSDEVVLVIPGDRAGIEGVTDAELETTVGGVSTENNSAQCETSYCHTW